MKQFIAVNHPAITVNIQALKQEALMFDYIAIPYLDTVLSIKDEESSEAIRNLNWLQELGIVFEPKVSIDPRFRHHEDFERGLEEAKGIIGAILGFSIDDLIQARGNEEKSASIKDKLDQLEEREICEVRDVLYSESMIQRATTMAAHLTRLTSIQMRELDGLETFPVVPADVLPEEQGKTTKNDVIRIVLRALPLPTDETPWEQIFEYRNDPDSKAKFLDLRNWIAEVARGTLSPNEVEEKLEYLLSQYRRHLELHRMKANTGTLETLVVTGADILGNLVSFQWGEAARALFSMKRRQLALLEGELTAHGSEVAYVMKARDAFF